LNERVKELEAELEAIKSDSPSQQPMPLRVRGHLKDIIRHPEHAVFHAEQALRHL